MSVGDGDRRRKHRRDGLSFRAEARGYVSWRAMGLGVGIALVPLLGEALRLLVR
jgi:hypothetical protein